MENKGKKPKQPKRWWLGCAKVMSLWIFQKTNRG